jgi:hypothetical protein
MPQYMLLIYGPAEGGLSPEEAQAEMPRWTEYTQSMQEAGVMVAGDPLEPVETATTVRERGGETVVTDGPFSETKEVLGGYYIVDVPDAETAQKWAARMPIIGRGSVEVRAIMVIPGMPQSATAQTSAQA